jgi:Na+/H+-dicarboxylate symporter
LETPVAKRLTLYILIAMLLGIVIGITLNQTIDDKATITNVTGYISILTDLFLRLIKMIIAPLVFSTLVVGIAHMGDTSALGRIGGRSIGWFLSASLLSLSLGLIMVNLMQPGVGLNLPLPDVTATSGVTQGDFSLKQFVTHLVPKSFFEAMATNEILQIVIFSIFTGVAMTAIGERAAPLLRGIEALVQVMLQITDYVMRFAPIAVFSAVTCALAEQGPGILITFGKFMGGFYLTMLTLWALLLGLCFLLVGSRTKLLVRYIREPILLAFTTASSEAAFPRTAGGARASFGVPQADRQFRAAARLFVQSRRLDDVLQLRDDVHRAGLWHPYRVRAADHHDAAADGDLQGHRQRAARQPGRDRLDPRFLRHSRGRATAYPRG